VERSNLSLPRGTRPPRLKVMELPTTGAAGRRLGDEARASVIAVFLAPCSDGLTPTAREVFDFDEQGMLNGCRDTTTVATQAL